MKDNNELYNVFVDGELKAAETTYSRMVETVVEEKGPGKNIKAIPA